MRMKIVLVMATTVAVAVAAAGCQEARSGRPAAQRVVAGFYPLAFAARQVAGPRIAVDDLTPPGAEPHDLEVSPGDVQRVRSARVVLLLGHGFQPQLEAAARGARRVVALLDTKGLSPQPSGDPHVWLDPSRFALVVERIGAVLHAPSGARRLVARLHRLDREYRIGLAHCRRHEIVTSHRAFAYLSRRYGLRQIAITGISPEAEPAPADLQRVVAAVRATHATTVFLEPLVSPRIARTVARETAARTAILDPVEGLTRAEAERGEDYFSLMRANLAALRPALGCR
jgi:zinc transport system substrate-binding protein